MNTSPENNLHDFTWAKNYLQEHEMDVRSARGCIPAVDVVFRTYSSKNHFNLTYSPVFVQFDGVYGAQIIAKENLELFENKMYSIAMKNINEIKEIIAKANSIQNAIETTYSNMEFANLSVNELTKHFKNLVELMSNWWKQGLLGEDKGIIADSIIVPMLMKNHSFDKNKANEIVASFSQPTKTSVFTKEYVDFLEICLYAEKTVKNKIIFEQNNYSTAIENKEFKKILEKHAKTYFYMLTDFYNRKIFTPKHLFNLVCEELKSKKEKEITAEIDSLKRKISEYLKKRTDFIKTYKPQPEELNSLEYVLLLSEWTDTRKLCMTQQFFYLFSLLNEISNRMNHYYENIALLTNNEIMGLLNGKNIDWNQIANRSNNLMILYTDGLDPIFFYKAEATTLNALARKKENNSKELSGSIASKGQENKPKISGIARVITNPQKEPFNKGDILVTSMTRIEFVPLMKKAKAIITDEGGVLCHAAVISRELGVPCIIGAHYATKMIKTGFEIELDMEKGIIRILSATPKK